MALVSDMEMKEFVLDLCSYINKLIRTIAQAVHDYGI